MAKIGTKLALITAIFLSTAVSRAQVAPQKYDDPEGYEVLSILIKTGWTVRVAKAERLVIKTETSDNQICGGNSKMCLTPAKGEEALYAPVIEAYQSLNKKPWTLQRKFDLTPEYDLVSAATIKSVFKVFNAWDDFYVKYPKSGGYIEMSAVGFNADKTIAIAYLAYYCNSLCAGGSYHVLEKKDGKWAEIEWKGDTVTWIS